MKRILILLIVMFGLTAFSGCPDYSHLREVPDYGNMTDGGGPNAVETFEEEGEE